MSPLLSNDDDATDITTVMARADADFSSLRMSDAAHGYRQILTVRPHDAHALHRMGLACAYMDDMSGASSYLELALQAAPACAELWEHAGLIAAMKNEPIRAEAFYRRALSLSGSTATLHRNLADCLRLSGRLAEAKAQYIQAISIEPDLHHAISAVARISTELGEIDDAAAYWLHAWALDSTGLADGLDLIYALRKANRQDEIEPVVARIRTSFPSDAAALKDLAYALNCIRSYREAISVAKQGLVIDPHNESLHLNAMYAFDALTDLSGLRTHCTEAVMFLPENAFVQYVLATLELQAGDFEPGWKRWKWHEKTEFFRAPVRPPFPEWAGEPLAAGCRFLLVKELGFGDQIQFLRMAHWLHQQGATVDVWVDAPLAELARSASGVHAVWTDLPPGAYDYFCPMLRMPEHMKLSVPMLPIVMPYISTTPEKRQAWQTYLDNIAPASKNTTRIGLVWAGDPTHPFDHRRSIELAKLKPLLAQPGITWCSVQKGRFERQSDALLSELDIHTLGPMISDFADTLAALQTFDLLITVDTSVAHLAGAAGLPVWVLLPAHADWRWMTDRTDSPWYPSMRLFRQRELGQWEPVVEAVRETLLAMRANEKSHP